MAKRGKVAQNKSQVIAELPLACSSEGAAVEMMEWLRWGDSPACPRCGDTDVYRMTSRQTGERNKRYLWRCRGCRDQYTVRIGTVFEDSRIPLRFWCYAFWKACSSKKGVSAKQIERETGLSYKSALFLMHRIRWAMAEEPGELLRGVVEIDETFVGGKPRKGSAPWHHMRPDQRRRGPAPDFKDRKTPVVAMVERGGRVRAVTPERITAAALRHTVFGSVDRSARIMTDERPMYRHIGKHYAGHDVVNHSRNEYVRGDVTTNTVEGFFSLLKRGVYGTFHSVSRWHLHRYVSEFAFRWNTRTLEDGARMQRAIQSAEGKRLRYRAPREGEE